MSDELQQLEYASWGQRFAAFCIDFIVLLPFVILATKLMWKPPFFSLVLLPLAVLGTAYPIVCHGLWGRTIGKRITGTRVTALDGGRISWRQAFLRNAPDIIWLFANAYALLMIYAHVAPEAYAGWPPTERMHLLKALFPAWYTGLTHGQDAWNYSEFIVILLNRRRRALHDFVAGTIVQREPTNRHRT